jgi:hypothetical protein
VAKTPAKLLQDTLSCSWRKTPQRGGLLYSAISSSNLHIGHPQKNKTWTLFVRRMLVQHVYRTRQKMWTFVIHIINNGPKCGGPEKALPSRQDKHKKTFRHFNVLSISKTGALKFVSCHCNSARGTFEHEATQPWWHIPF